MTFSAIKVGGWAYGEVLTSAQMNSLNTDHVLALDGGAGGNYSTSSALKIVGQTGPIHARVTAGADADTTYNVQDQDLLNVGVLTANRSYTLGTTEATAGAQVWIQHKGADVYNLIVKNHDGTALTALRGAAGDWAEFTYISSNWVKTGGSGTQLVSALDINAAVFSGSYDVSSETSAPKAAVIGDSGTKAYVLAAAAVYQYDLGYSYDISTASYASKSLNTTTQSTTNEALCFKSDGTELYVVEGSGSSAVYQYTLSTAWDLSSASYTGTSGAISEATDMHGVAINSGGTQMWLGSNNNDTIYEYTMSPAYDITSLSYASKSLATSSDVATLNGIALSATLDRVIVLDSTRWTIAEYFLTTLADISTGVYSGVLKRLDTADSTVQGLDWQLTGGLCTALDSADSVYQYQTVRHIITRY